MTNLAARARSALLRRIAGIRIAQVPPLRIPKTHECEFRIDASTLAGNLSVSAASRAAEFGFLVGSMVDVHAVSIVHRRLETSFEPSPRALGIVKPDNIRIRQGVWEVPHGELRSLDLQGVLPGAKASEFRISPFRSVEEVPVRIKPSAVGEVELAHFGFPRRDLDIICRRPIAIRPTPWAGLDRRFIIECWETLRKAAREKLDGDPGRDLEMSAVFANVDLSHTRKTRYDQKKRELRVFVDSPARSRKSGKGPCAVIVGLLKATGEILMVAMPLDGRS